MISPRHPPYPVDAFHLLTSNAIREVRWILKAPEAMVAVSFLATSAIAVQGLADVELPIFNEDPSQQVELEEGKKLDQPVQRVPLTLNLATVAVSGERKTAVDRAVAKSVRTHDDKRLSKYETDVDSHDAEMSVWNSIHQGLHRKLIILTKNAKPTDSVETTAKVHALSKPTQPRLRQTIRSDISKSALTEVLRGDGESIALMSNEGDIPLRSEAMQHLAWLNSAWDGSTLLIDRANGRSVAARSPRVTTNLMIQPEAFQRFIEKRGDEARDIGFFARYLVAWPMSTQGSRFITGTEGSWKHLPKFHARVKELLEEYDRRLSTGKIKRDLIRFTPEARARWIEQVNFTEQAIQEGGALFEVKDAASKANEIAARIAGILHYFEGTPGDITVDTLERAIAIMDWHIGAFIGLLVPGYETPQVLKDAERLRGYLYRIMRQMQQSALNCNWVERNSARHDGPLRRAARFGPALKVLEECGAVNVDYHHGDSNQSYPRKRGPLYIYFTNKLGYPVMM